MHIWFAESSHAGLCPSAGGKGRRCYLAFQCVLCLKAEQAVLGGLAALAAAQLIGEGGLCHLSAQVSQLHLLQRPHQALSLPSLQCVLQQGGLSTRSSGSAASAAYGGAENCLPSISTLLHASRINSHTVHWRVQQNLRQEGATLCAGCRHMMQCQKPVI